MTLTDIAALAVSIITIIGSSAAGIRWLVKHYLAELRPNSGGSLKDQVSRLEEKVNDAESLRKEMSKKIDDMYRILLDHVAKTKN